MENFDDVVSFDDHVSFNSLCSSLTAESAATVVLRRIEANESSNRKMLQKFLGVRPKRRHASMRRIDKSAERRTDEAIPRCYLDQVREDPEQEEGEVSEEEGEDMFYYNDEGDISSEGIMEQSIPCTVEFLSEDVEVDEKPKSCIRKRGRLANISSSLACVTCGSKNISKYIEQEEHDEELEERLCSAESVSVNDYEQEDENKIAGSRQKEAETRALLVPLDFYTNIFDTYLHTSMCGTGAPNRHTIECATPWDSNSVDVFDYEFSVGSITEME